MSEWYRVVEERVHKFYSSSQNYTEYLKEKQDGFRYICIWGVGNLGRPTVTAFRKYNLRADFYCDNDCAKWGKEYDGIKCIPLEELLKIKDETLIIICARAYNDIFKQLRELGCPHLDRVFMNKFIIREYLAGCKKDELLKNVKNVMDICADEQSKKILAAILLEWLENKSGNLDDICTYDQYFCEDIFQMTDHEVFVDCGAYNGDTMQEFLKIKGDRFSELILFELSKENFKELKKNVGLLDKEIQDKIVLHNKGVADRKEEIWYAEMAEGSNILQEGEGKRMKGSLTTIDEECKNSKVTYIKMDIEGSEMAALRGAEQCILADKPKLAICLYHEPQDIWEIPLFIKKILPEYRIYIRHHTNLLNETVCYAVI